MKSCRFGHCDNIYFSFLTVGRDISAINALLSDKSTAGVN